MCNYCYFFFFVFNQQNMMPPGYKNVFHQCDVDVKVLYNEKKWNIMK